MSAQATWAVSPSAVKPIVEHRKITKPSLVKGLLFKQGTFKRPQTLFKVNLFKHLWLCSQVSYWVKKKNCQIYRAGKGFSPSSFMALYPQVTFFCNLSLETITLPRSPDAHQHTEQMRRQSWETDRSQSDTFQVWLCGYVSLFPHFWVVWSVPGESTED